jgi:hypothetical protein
MTTEQRAAVERIRATHRTPEFRAEAQRVRVAVMEEFPPAHPERDTREALGVLRQERELVMYMLLFPRLLGHLDFISRDRINNEYSPDYRCGRSHVC